MIQNIKKSDILAIMGVMCISKGLFAPYNKVTGFILILGIISYCASMWLIKKERKEQKIANEQ
jgi:hypothetical protein